MPDLLQFTSPDQVPKPQQIKLQQRRYFFSAIAVEWDEAHSLSLCDFLRVYSIRTGQGPSLVIAARLPQSEIAGAASKRAVEIDMATVTFEASVRRYSPAIRRGLNWLGQSR